MENLEQIIINLKGNPMFHLSLGSKELFHSNFLEFLWNQNREIFIEMLNELLPKAQKIEIGTFLNQNGLALAREKENFDVCIYHEDEEKIIYDVIIENKVKSIPYKEQLERYEKKVEDNQGIKPRKKPRYLPDDKKPTYILLSLATKFADRDAIEKDNNWTIINYRQLAERIEAKFLGSSEIEDTVKNYIRDYCVFIRQLHKLQQYCLRDINSSIFYKEDNEDENALQAIRLHDLYLKLRGSYFVGELYKKLHEEIPEVAISIEPEKRKDDKTDIFISSGMNNGKSTITAAIYLLEQNVFYTIQLEGKQYRHIFDKIDLAKECSYIPVGKMRTQISADKVENRIDSKTMKYLQFEEPFAIDDLNCENDGNISDYCKYAPNAIYRYKTIVSGSITFEKMLDVLSKDIVRTYNQFK